MTNLSAFIGVPTTTKNYLLPRTKTFTNQAIIDWNSSELDTILVNITQSIPGQEVTLRADQGIPIDGQRINIRLNIGVGFTGGFLFIRNNLELPGFLDSVNQLNTVPASFPTLQYPDTSSASVVYFSLTYILEDNSWHIISVGRQLT